MKRTILVSDFREEAVRERRRARLPDLDLLEVQDVAPYFGITEAAIRKRIRIGKLGPWSFLGRRWTIRKETFERWLDTQEKVLK